MPDEDLEQEGLDQEEAGSQVSFDQIEHLLEEEEDQEPEPKPAQDLSAIKVEEGDEDVKGRSVAELVERAKNLERALKISEEARLSASTQADRAAAHQAPPPPAPEAEVTDEQIVELMKEDPVRALQVMRMQNARMVEQHVNRRVGPLTSGTVNMAERDARARWADEFELFGPQITQFVNGIQDKTALASADGWDNVIAYVRGMKGNFEKLVDHRISKQTGGLETARKRERESAGFTAKPAKRASVSTDSASEESYGLDETQREVARNLGMSYKEYFKWSKIK